MDYDSVLQDLLCLLAFSYQSLTFPTAGGTCFSPIIQLKVMFPPRREAGWDRRLRRNHLSHLVRTGMLLKGTDDVYTVPAGASETTVLRKPAMIWNNNDGDIRMRIQEEEKCEMKCLRKAAGVIQLDRLRNDDIIKRKILYHSLSILKYNKNHVCDIIWEKNTTNSLQTHILK